jgi:radical SAM superfamily enzyme with C-terminal helix-hairpin-helix motif
MQPMPPLGLGQTFIYSFLYLKILADNSKNRGINVRKILYLVFIPKKKKKKKKKEREKNKGKKNSILIFRCDSGNNIF